jgi:quinolinate synthase
MLSGCQCLCTTMYRIDMPHLLWVLDNLASGKVVNQIKVHPTVKQWSLESLNRMLKVTADANRAVVQPVTPPTAAKA